MSTDRSATTDSPLDEIAELRDRVDELQEELAAMSTESVDEEQRMTIIATQGTLDMAYPPLILASTAAAFGWHVTVFHTFWGLEILHEERSQGLKISSVGNPNVPLPNAIATLPGMDQLTTRLMKEKIADNDTASIQELVETCLELGVDLQACQMTMDLLDYDETELYDGVTTRVGAATALNHMADADIQLLI